MFIFILQVTKIKLENIGHLVFLLIQCSLSGTIFQMYLLHKKWLGQLGSRVLKKKFLVSFSVLLFDS